MGPDSPSAWVLPVSLADDGLGMLGELCDVGLGRLGELDDGGLGMLGELGDDGLGMLVTTDSAHWAALTAVYSAIDTR